jgi:hypothetical protein
MAAIGFFGVGILWAYIFYHPEIAGLIGALIFGTIGCIFGWRKAVPLAEIPMFEAAKKVCLHILKMFFILITLATHVGILFESLMGDYSERVMVIGLILIVIYWLIVLVTPPADPARAGTKKRLRWRIAFAELIGFCFVGFTVFVIKSIKSSRQANVEDFIGPLVGYLVLIALLAVSIVQVVKAVRYNKRLEHETQSNAKGG